MIRGPNTVNMIEMVLVWLPGGCGTMKFQVCMLWITKRKLVGILDADDVQSTIDAGQKDLRSIVKSDVPTTKMDTPLADLLDAVSTTPVPFAVVDDHDRLRGIIIRGAVLGALSGQEGQCQC